jgi:tetratricopeptide (TPR) repeat protein
MTQEPAAVVAARTAVDAQRYDEAITLLRDHLTTSPDDAQAWHRLSGALSGADRKREALEAADRATTLAPDNAVAHRMRALALVFLKRFPEAEHAATRAIELNARDPEAHALLGEALKNQRRASGNDAIRAALALDPANQAARTTAERWGVTAHKPGWLTSRLSPGGLAWSGYARRAILAPAVVLGLLFLLLAGGPSDAVLGGTTAALIVAAIVLSYGTRLAEPQTLGWQAPAAMAVGGGVVTLAALLGIGAPGKPTLAAVGLTVVLELLTWYTTRPSPDRP